ncbi:MAG: DUF835 domain-containing protein [Methanomassiliicoccales archaeon]|nr:DUF835 domain-containing protein [Methanomassiliicoccales archaeon]
MWEVKKVCALLATDTVGEAFQKVESVSVNVGGEVLIFDCGRTYFVVDQRLDKMLGIARDLVGAGNNVLCISRFHPDLVNDRWSERGMKSIWLSERPGTRNVPPSQLSRLTQDAASFTRNNPSSVIMLDGIEYLSLFNDFQRLQMFIEQMNDIVMESHAILLIAVDPRLFDSRSLARLQRFAEIVN